MAQAGDVIEGHGGFGLRLVRTGAETDGELLEMEASYAGDGVFPPRHLHPSQDERFEVLEGTVRAILDGDDRTYGPGDVFEVPAGTPHQMTADTPARVTWQVRPALRTAEFFEGLYGSGPDSASELGAAFLERYSDEFRLA